MAVRVKRAGMSEPPMMNAASGQSRVLAAAALVVVCFAALIVVSPRILIDDERYYMASSLYLAAHFAWAGPLRIPLDLAAGPLYPHLHVLLSPLTQLQVPAVRYVNLAALGLTLASCWRTIAHLGYRDAPARAAMLLAVPMIGPTGGMARTEVPALAMAALAVLGAVEAVTAKASRKPGCGGR